MLVRISQSWEGVDFRVGPIICISVAVGCLLSSDPRYARFSQMASGVQTSGASVKV